MESRSWAVSRSVVWAGVARTTLALASALAITNMGLPQYVTGPLVNALLLLTLEWCGVSQALVVGMVTPMGAAVRGILPLPLWVMIPFIAVGNAVFVGIFHVLRGRNRAVALVVAAVAKFAGGSRLAAGSIRPLPSGATAFCSALLTATFIA